MFQYVIESDTGRKRKVNEDRVAVLKRPGGLLLALVADGMGGHNAGDVASRMAVDELGRRFMEADEETFETTEEKTAWLSGQVLQVNRLVYEHSITHSECKGMGTTLIAALIEEDDCVLCHIGDSRAYVIGPSMAQVTRDHSYVNVLVDNGEITQQQAEDHPKKNWILRSLGTEPDIEREMHHFSLAGTSYFLICTDGLSNKLNERDISSIVRSKASLSQKGKALIALANDLGGEDNISFVLLTALGEEV
ncbi:Stp1/IreP family PP2C-type Ser/Thr phosphatase [Planococcus maitriensis]|uniref:Stp1/IreP family PP2C-type Ser/Thr phosphatase n=1 Tax=Planococcus maitriensis TaxID=221799 RepID=A0A365KB55_9BACL|nr:Stp1/IreP family PP2C-type Ser/Thr phosphatase [Planococcus maitriensis]RAZ70033.1 Stp1/IreP family PP2C-type Ser/Thr phosphatase [Planococcus maitriensis]